MTENVRRCLRAATIDDEIPCCVVPARAFDRANFLDVCFWPITDLHRRTGIDPYRHRRTGIQAHDSGRRGAGLCGETQVAGSIREA